MMDLNQIKNFDWRSLKTMMSSQSAEDFNAFLEKLPENTNKLLLIITGVVWAAAATMGLFATVQGQSLTALRAELQDAKATEPTVPSIQNLQVDRQEVENFVKTMQELYKNLNITANDSSIVIEADDTGFFGQFREAIGHVQNGNRQWRVNVEKLCVGRECERKPLAASLKIIKVDIKV